MEDVFEKDSVMKKEYRLAYFQGDGKLKVFEREHETREEVQRIIDDLKNPRRRYAVAERDVSEWRISKEEKEL